MEMVMTTEEELQDALIAGRGPFFSGKNLYLGSLELL
jgi:hypothetical protein